MIVMTSQKKTSKKQKKTEKGSHVMWRADRLSDTPPALALIPLTRRANFSLAKKEEDRTKGCIFHQSEFL